MTPKLRIFKTGERWCLFIPGAPPYYTEERHLAPSFRFCILLMDLWLAGYRTTNSATRLPGLINPH